MSRKRLKFLLVCCVWTEVYVILPCCGVSVLYQTVNTVINKCVFLANKGLSWMPLFKWINQYNFFLTTFLHLRPFTFADLFSGAPTRAKVTKTFVAL